MAGETVPPTRQTFYQYLSAQTEAEREKAVIAGIDYGDISGMEIMALMFGVAGDQYDRLLKGKAADLAAGVRKIESLADQSEAIRTEIEAERAAKKAELGDGFKESEFVATKQADLDSMSDKTNAANLVSQKMMQEMQLLVGKAAAIEKAQDNTLSKANDTLSHGADKI